jgi:hypothetical protein
MEASLCWQGQRLTEVKLQHQLAEQLPAKSSIP